MYCEPVEYHHPHRLQSHSLHHHCHSACLAQVQNVVVLNFERLHSTVSDNVANFGTNIKLSNNIVVPRQNVVTGMSPKYTITPKHDRFQDPIV